MSEENLERDIKRLRADKKKLLNILQTMLNDTQTLFEPGNKMENASEAMIRLRKVMQQS
jgi:hypothetical protein